jgi:hypothetical protein
MYLGWYDPDKHKSFTDKLRDACARFEERFGRAALVALVNPADAATISQAPLGVEVRPAKNVAPNTIFAGEDEPEVVNG